MIISLVMLLVLMAMGIAITHVANLQSNLVSAVTDKSLSIDAAETCFDNALEWLVTPAGQGWVKGTGLPLDLAATGNALNGKTLLVDTAPSSGIDPRNSKFKKRIESASYSSCIVEKLTTITADGIGNEIGTPRTYNASNLTFTIRITAVGQYNISTLSGAIKAIFWKSNASQSTLEAVVLYTP